MAEASPGIPLAMLSRVAACHIREETYTQALAELVNYHHRIGFTGHWGDGLRLLLTGSAFAPAVTATPTDRPMRVTAMILR
jgi:TnpA family transposase